MSIHFDDDAAQALQRAAKQAEAKLDEQLFWRRTSAEKACVDFSGSYSALFQQAATLEAEDRAQLVRAF